MHVKMKEGVFKIGHQFVVFVVMQDGLVLWCSIFILFFFILRYHQKIITSHREKKSKFDDLMWNITIWAITVGKQINKRRICIGKFNLNSAVFRRNSNKDKYFLKKSYYAEYFYIEHSLLIFYSHHKISMHLRNNKLISASITYTIQSGWHAKWKTL